MARAVSPAATLCAVLAQPERALALDGAGWTALVSVARAEQLAGALAHRVEGLDLPAPAVALMAEARDIAREARRAALWEAEWVRRCLAPLGVPLVLLKGTAFMAAGLAAGQGRLTGDLDLLVPRAALDRVEVRLREAGWEWAKPDAYDLAYYRQWMHELPPLLHRERDRMVDVHHNILPPTARRAAPDAERLLAAAVPLEGGFSVLSPADMVVHAALHLFADGDLAGGLRNLWDIDRLLREFAEADPDFWMELAAHAAEHCATAPLARALRLSRALFETPLPDKPRLRACDLAFRRRLLARDGWGRETRPVTRLAFYIRSHWIRMPAGLLARHLAIKARRRVRAGSA